MFLEQAFGELTELHDCMSESTYMLIFSVHFNFVLRTFAGSDLNYWRDFHKNSTVRCIVC